MKNILLIAYFLLSCLSAQAQEEYYVVLHVKGKVSLTKSGELLKPNTQVSPNAKVTFSSPNDLVAVLHPTKGRSIMKPSRNPESGSSELIAFVKNTLVAGTGRASTRAGKFTNFIEIDSFFTASPLMYYKGQVALIGPKVKFKVSQEAFPLNAKSFFFARYEYNGEVINKKMGFEGDAFILDKESLYKIDGQPITPSQIRNFQLFYRNATTNQSTFITKTKPNFVPEFKLREEVELLMEYYLKDKGEEKIIEELLEYIADAHGKVDKDHLIEFLDKHFPNWKG